ncbi:MAG TPA: hypothetical protein VEH04_09385 [Verrucomicrobiae bacterium]|nr:hypothetical protein [Verrucomicrobiae bacterium]
MNSETDDLEAPKLAELQESILDSATLNDLFRDLRVCTEVIEVIPRASRHQMVAERTLTLEEAKEKILSGAINGLQIRYRYEGAEWWDTLLRLPQGVRIVRIRHEF